MGLRTSHPVGAFSWADVATPSRAATASFYGGLLGWRLDDVDAGADAGYGVFLVGDHAVAGLAGLSEEQQASGARPGWTNYVTVVSVEPVAARAEELGGSVVVDAFDVGDDGRALMLADPHGAVVALWEPRGAIGAERVNDVGCMTMNELATDDTDAARAFYEALFGWTTEVVDTGPGGPLIVSVMNDGRLNGTISEAVGAPPHWRPYFTVESTDDATTRVRELGGTVVFGPVPTGDGSIAVALDDQGAIFGLFAGETDE